MDYNRWGVNLLGYFLTWDLPFFLLQHITTLRTTNIAISYRIINHQHLLKIIKVQSCNDLDLENSFVYDPHFEQLI